MLSDKEIAEVLALVDVVLRKPACHHKVIGNPQISCTELERLNTAWLTLDALVTLATPFPFSLLSRLWRKPRRRTVCGRGCGLSARTVNEGGALCFAAGRT